MQKILTAIILCVCFFLPLERNFLTSQLMHANWAHLLGNVGALCCFNRKVFRYPVALCFVIGAAVMAFYSAVGFSCAILAMCGINFSYARNWKSVLSLAVLFTMYWFLPGMSFSMHFLAFVCGGLAGTLKLVHDDYKRYFN